MDELAIKVDDKFYFTIHKTDDAFDYSVYDTNYELIDGGTYDIECNEKILNVVDAIAECDCPKGLISLLDRSKCIDVDYNDLTEKIYAHESKPFSLKVLKQKEAIIKNSSHEKVNSDNKLHSEVR